MWLGRATVVTVGLILTLALILGVGRTALASVPGDPFELGEINAISDALTKPMGSRDGGLC